MNKIVNIAKNTSYFTFALILQKVISFTYFALIARSLGPEDLGKYYFAISFTTIFAIFIDLGLANVLTREVAKAKERLTPRSSLLIRRGGSEQRSETGERFDAQNLLSSVLIIKIPLAILSLLSAVILINLMGYPEIIRQLVYLSVVCMVLDSFSLTFYACLRGLHNLLFESIAVVVFQLIVLSLGLTVLHFNLGLFWLMGVMVIASSFNFFYSLSLIKFKWKMKILMLGWALKPILTLKSNLTLIKTIIKIAVPFGMFAVFQRLYMYLDTVLLSTLAGDVHTGLYQIAFKIIFALQFLPMAFMASLYPAFASYWKQNRQQLSVSFDRAMNYLIIISLPIAVGVIVLADKIILIFKSDYAAAILPLQLIMCSLLFIFLNFPIGSLLNACDRQKVNTKNMGIILAVSVIMNLILIPKFQTVGASVTVVATNFLMFILGMRWVPKIIAYRPKVIIKIFLKSLSAVAIMGLTAFYLKSMLNVFVVVMICGMVYFAVLFLFGGFKKEDVLSICTFFKDS